MSLGVLNNIAAIYAQNNLNNTQNSLQTTLTQLSSGSRINSGADDAAGLAVADGLHANEAALTQSAQNAQNGIGLLQTADGALSQVTSLLNRAVTLSTESANGTLTSTQASTANQEYQNILNQIASIGSTTNFNSNAVFSNTVSTIFVSDGTAAGANSYSDVVGVLAQNSIGQTIAAPITSAAVAPVTIAPQAAVTNTAGVYTLTPAGAVPATDTFSGTLAFRVGPSGTQETITVAPGTTTAALATQLTANNAFSAAGLTANVSSGVLSITGGTSGANAAANTVNFAGTSLTDGAVGTSVTFTGGPSASLGTASTDTLTASGTSGASNYAGTFTLTQGGLTASINVTPAVGTAAALTQIQNQLAAQGANFTVVNTGTINIPVFTFTGPKTGTALNVVVGTFAASGGGSIAESGASTGTAPTAGTSNLAALALSTDVFGAASSVVVNGHASLNLAGLTGTQAAALIATQGAAQSAGAKYSAAFNTSTKVLTVTGDPSGTSLTVTPTTITDAPAPVNVTSLVTLTPATGSASAGATSAITLGGANNTLSGTLNLVVGTSGLPVDTLALTIAPGTSAVQLANQINQNKAFAAAGVSANYNPANYTITLTGPVGTANTLVTTGTTLTDSSSAAPGAGIDFTQTQVSALNAGTAQNILVAATSAIADVAYQRGIIGANINELTAASGVASAESVNLTAAESSIRSTNYGQATSDLAKYKVLSETGISALAQANTVQQEVTKLLQ